VSRAIFWFGVLCWITDVVLWGIINNNTGIWNHIPHYGTYGEDDFMPYTCRACHVLNVNLINGYVLLLWILAAALLDLITKLKANKLTAALKARYEDAIPQKTAKRGYGGVTRRSGSAALAQGICHQLEMSSPSNSSDIAIGIDAQASFQSAQNLERCHTMTEVMDRELNELDVSQEYDSRTEYNNSNSNIPYNDEFNAQGEAYFERWNNEEQLTKSNMTMASFFSDDEEDDTDNPAGSPGEEEL
jgi:hypothetical protein